MSTEKPATKAYEPASLASTIVGAAVTFLVSLPIMWLIGNYAAFTYGLGVWILPYLGGSIGLHFLAYRGVQGYQIVTIIFAVLAAIQNAALLWWNQRSKSSSAVLHRVLLALLALTVLGVLVGILLMLAL